MPRQCCRRVDCCRLCALAGLYCAAPLGSSHPLPLLQLLAAHEEATGLATRLAEAERRLVGAYAGW